MQNPWLQDLLGLQQVNEGVISQQALKSQNSSVRIVGVSGPWWKLLLKEWDLASPPFAPLERHVLSTCLSYHRTVSWVCAALIGMWIQSPWIISSHFPLWGNVKGLSLQNYLLIASKCQPPISLTRRWDLRFQIISRKEKEAACHTSLVVICCGQGRQE